MTEKKSKFRESKASSYLHEQILRETHLTFPIKKIFLLKKEERMQIEEIGDIYKANIEFEAICQCHLQKLRDLRSENLSNYKTAEWEKLKMEFRREISKYISLRIFRYNSLCDQRQWVHALAYLLSLARISNWGWRGKDIRFFETACRRVPFEILKFYISTFQIYLGPKFYAGKENVAFNYHITNKLRSDSVISDYRS